MLPENPHGGMGASADRAINGERAILRQGAQRSTQVIERDVFRSRSVTIFKFIRIAHIEQLAFCKARILPVKDGIVTPQVVLCDHADEIQDILGRAELGGIAKFRFRKIIDGGGLLDRHGDDVDAFVHPGFSHGLRPEDPPVRRAENELEVNSFRPGKVSGMVTGVEIDFFIVGEAGALQGFFACPSGRHGEIEDAADRAVP